MAADLQLCEEYEGDYVVEHGRSDDQLPRRRVQHLVMGSGTTLTATAARLRHGASAFGVGTSDG